MKWMTSNKTELKTVVADLQSIPLKYNIKWFNKLCFVNEKGDCQPIEQGKICQNVRTARLIFNFLILVSFHL